AIPTVPATISGNFGRFMEWADKARRLQVYTNADTPKDARQARAFGAEGIGLTRTEHMFFEGTRIKAMREMIVSDTTEERRKALAKILPYQQGDFEGLYTAMEGRPVIIRFLDPPLHEFLPTKEKDIEEIAGEMNISVQHLKDVISSLHEFNPMMGHRGCRLCVSYPEIAEMQTTAVINAAINVNRAHPEYHVEPRIMIPLVGEIREMRYVKSLVTKTADKLIQKAGVQMKYQVGTMI
ncbi:MAG TPA: pyruvate, phosphate dikinase, partial [Ruminococcaceae bacterium]|nr:pyruvate, phosphate dikinase [Oscillospiraceae bacterium]